jgi:hypothetical protein
MKLMKTTILTIAAIAFLTIFFACDQKKAQGTDNVTKKTNPIEDVAEKEDPAEQPADKPYEAVGYKKTPCFGKCPVYEVKIYSDNTATWYGKMNVERIGWYEAKLTGTKVQDIKDKASELGYLDFYNEYPVEHKVADLPSTITTVRYGDMIKSVKNTIEGPEKLNEFEAYLEGVINRLDWKPSEKRD